jgi:hypothetical protein
MVMVATLWMPRLAAADDLASDYGRIRRALAAPASLASRSREAADGAHLQVTSGRGFGVPFVVVRGAGSGPAGGYLWARQQCGGNDPECAAIANPIGIVVGAAIGATVGAILDAFSH